MVKLNKDYKPASWTNSEWSRYQNTGKFPHPHRSTGREMAILEDHRNGMLEIEREENAENETITQDSPDSIWERPVPPPLRGVSPLEEAVQALEQERDNWLTFSEVGEYSDFIRPRLQQPAMTFDSPTELERAYASSDAISIRQFLKAMAIFHHHRGRDTRVVIESDGRVRHYHYGNNTVDQADVSIPTPPIVEWMGDIRGAGDTVNIRHVGDIPMESEANQDQEVLRDAGLSDLADATQATALSIDDILNGI